MSLFSVIVLLTVFQLHSAKPVPAGYMTYRLRRSDAEACGTYKKVVEEAIPQLLDGVDLERVVTSAQWNNVIICKRETTGTKTTASLVTRGSCHAAKVTAVATAAATTATNVATAAATTATAVATAAATTATAVATAAATTATAVATKAAAAATNAAGYLWNMYKGTTADQQRQQVEEEPLRNDDNGPERMENNQQPQPQPQPQVEKEPMPNHDNGPPRMKVRDCQEYREIVEEMLARASIPEDPMKLAESLTMKHPKLLCLLLEKARASKRWRYHLYTICHATKRYHALKKHANTLGSRVKAMYKGYTE